MKRALHIFTCTYIHVPLAFFSLWKRNLTHGITWNLPLHLMWPTFTHILASEWTFCNVEIKQCHMFTFTSHGLFFTHCVNRNVHISILHFHTWTTHILYVTWHIKLKIECEFHIFTCNWLFLKNMWTKIWTCGHTITSHVKWTFSKVIFFFYILYEQILNDIGLLTCDMASASFCKSGPWTRRGWFSGGSGEGKRSQNASKIQSACSVLENI